MGVLYSQASFKNSRVASRKPTSAASTFPITVDGTPANTLISNTLNRTYLTIRNTSQVPGDDIRYDYFDNPTMATTGFLLRAGEAVDLEAPEAVYAIETAGTVIADCDEGTG